MLSTPDAPDLYQAALLQHQGEPSQLLLLCWLKSLVLIDRWNLSHPLSGSHAASPGSPRGLEVANSSEGIHIVEKLSHLRLLC